MQRVITFYLFPYTHVPTHPHPHTHSNMISFPPAALTSLVKVQVEIFQNASGAQAITNSPNTPDYTVSAFTWVGPQQFPDVQGSATVQLALSGTGPNVQVYRANESWIPPLPTEWPRPRPTAEACLWPPPPRRPSSPWRPCSWSSSSWRPSSRCLWWCTSG